MLNTSFNQIVNSDKIGWYEKVDLNEIQGLADRENSQVIKNDSEKVLFLGIDIQNDFMDNGALGVPGAHEDIMNINHFIYQNFDRITHIAVSLDTHYLKQIFHPSWWVDQNGKHPEPLTVISLEDVENGKWQAIQNQSESLQYVKGLEQKGQKQLCIWPYHCIEGTPGAALESQFSRMIHFHSFVKGVPIKKIVKGKDLLSEKYGIVKPEFSPDDQTDYELLQYISGFDKVVIGGEAESHCVIESVKQIAEHFSNQRYFTENIYVLTDCMSCIPGYEHESNQEWLHLIEQYGIQLFDSTKLKL
ncbi:cysteine hydrolase family protein [Alkalibacillus aidingensis]|uniref:hypothetical protein n=1 Tax=Alkalibacillus aidingensis TaxID=2747607 RepID=UPI0016605481|nr:hypothetical protein [Alkalibacillus aidingensis]